jgi:hypothetical protein
MIRYLYVPIEKDIDGYIEDAFNNKFNQIIHGESDIIKDFIKDVSETQEITIPEFRHIKDGYLVYEEKHMFKIVWIDEVFNKKDEGGIFINLYKLDDKDLNKREYLFSQSFEEVYPYIYETQLSLDSYGEYPIEIVYKDSVTDYIVFSDSIIIYKKYEEESKANDRFFFLG